MAYEVRILIILLYFQNEQSRINLGKPYFSYHFTIQLTFLPYFPYLFTIQLTFLPYFPYLFTIQLTLVWEIQKKGKLNSGKDMEKTEERQVE
jgi:hypothetical protein